MKKRYPMRGFKVTWKKKTVEGSIWPKNNCNIFATLPEARKNLLERLWTKESEIKIMIFELEDNLEELATHIANTKEIGRENTP